MSERDLAKELERMQARMEIQQKLLEKYENRKNIEAYEEEKQRYLMTRGRSPSKDKNLDTGVFIPTSVAYRRPTITEFFFSRDSLINFSIVCLCLVSVRAIVRWWSWLSVSMRKRHSYTVQDRSNGGTRFNREFYQSRGLNIYETPEQQQKRFEELRKNLSYIDPKEFEVSEEVRKRCRERRAKFEKEFLGANRGMKVMI